MDAPLRLLFIEDVSAEAELALSQFTRHGIACDWRRVDTEPDLRQELAAFKPHVVLSDFRMPQLDGWTALACVRAFDPDLPFVFVSGTIGEEAAIEALRHGAMDYVLKGNLARLVPAVQRARREVELRREQRRATQQLHDIVHTSQDWIWELDAERHILFTSPAVEPMLGRSPGEVVKSAFLDHVAVEQRNSVDVELNALDAGRRAARFLVPFSACNGQRRWLETNVLALIGEDARVVGFRGSSRDVSEREEQQQRINRLKRIVAMVSGVNGALVRLRDRNQLLQETCRIAVSVGGYVSAVVSLVEPGQVLRVEVVAGASEVTVGTQLPLTGV